MLEGCDGDISGRMSGAVDWNTEEDVVAVMRDGSWEHAVVEEVIP